ncbi:Cholinesterase 1-like [Homarus americanus]|uniref:Cholinesterase 1-like n=1 Tax=Homarus americanus TaxID=6706 RepID=A0A8J5T3H5_HOMAM|nr:Cholinesterase 1-like [Homarus americanus]
MYLGGDPNRVTIFGGNTGAASVHFQMLTPFAKDVVTLGNHLLAEPL